MSVLLLLETPVAALAAWWFMGQGIKPATVPGLLLITIGVTVVAVSGRVEQATVQRGRHRRTEKAPYLAHAPQSPQPPFESAQLTVPDAAKWDPGVDWAGHPRDDSPTITLAYHGAGAFDTRLVRTPHMKQEELGLDGPH